MCSVIAEKGDITLKEMRPPALGRAARPCVNAPLGASRTPEQVLRMIGYANFFAAAGREADLPKDLQSIALNNNDQKSPHLLSFYCKISL